ncbi:asparagine synthase (glutamine-hydrolyzing), partial [Fulvivirga lutimaris]|uniref:asparagine synthase (glutamine-hydrolyzing) n=1 Tax=Fulvivirga lutimaris TaxID=1819566 RepID=UPI0012BBFFBB
MCGIAGFLNFDFNDSYFDQVNFLQQHRGPDAQNSYQNENLKLFHQRLSIIDISDAANQPFEKDGLVVVFNGEIYNYKSLRKKLSSTGVYFSTTSDTEVLLELYRAKGADCLNDLKGMFAFAIYDKRSGNLFVARDPFGIKPFFFYSNGNQFAFASELKTLVKAPGVNKALNLNSLTASLNYLWIPGNDSMFSSIEKLPAGHYAIVGQKGKIELKQYYKPSTLIRFSNENEAIEAIDIALQNSVKRHLEADVPVSAFLSGGLDSSLLSVLAGKHQPLSTYSIAITQKDKNIEQMPDDAKYARQLAKQHGFEHHEIQIDPSITDELPHMVYHLDEPIGDPAAINTYLISKAARDNGVKVLLSGMGADELFFGYRRQMATLLALKYQNIPKPLRSLVKATANVLPVKIGSRGIKPVRWAQRFFSFANLSPADAYQRSYSYYDSNELNNLFTGDVTTQTNEMINSHRSIFNEAYGDKDYINKMCFTDMHYFMQGLNLTYTDRASMAASVEVRVPFIDKEVVELALAIKGDLKYKNKTQKYLLKKVGERHL